MQLLHSKYINNKSLSLFVIVNKIYKIGILFGIEVYLYVILYYTVYKMALRQLRQLVSLGKSNANMIGDLTSNIEKREKLVILVSNNLFQIAALKIYFYFILFEFNFLHYIYANIRTI
jgi:hypothetical protein